MSEPAGDTDLRDTLATLPGVGLKTASWIVRNYRASGAVAIIDVHILRAGHHLGLFESQWTPSNQYRLLESQFLKFAAAIETLPTLLDSIMWDQMRRMPLRHQRDRRVRTNSPIAVNRRQFSLRFGCTS